MKKYKQQLKNLWHFIWEEDSLLSWVVNVAIAFVLIKFIVYPGLGFLLGTSFPVVAVVSGSMEHDGNFDDWWHSPAVCQSGGCSQKQWYNEKGITEAEFTKFIFKNGFNKGDIIVLIGEDPTDVEVGDVIVFASSEPYPIIHRVVEMGAQNDKRYFETKGDHNELKGPNDLHISEDRLIGKAVVRIPLLGWIKIWFFDLITLLGKGISAVG